MKWFPNYRLSIQVAVLLLASIAHLQLGAMSATAKAEREAAQRPVASMSPVESEYLTFLKDQTEKAIYAATNPRPVN